MTVTFPAAIKERFAQGFNEGARVIEGWAPPGTALTARVNQPTAPAAAHATPRNP